MTSRSVHTLAAALVTAAALAACGGSRGISSSTSRGSGVHSRAIAFANCMRAHGVPGFPDPSGGGGGFDLTSSDVNAKSPAFDSARRTCTRLAPGNRAGPPLATEAQFLAAVKFAQCMRSHGLSDFPDPTRTDGPPAPVLVIGPGLYFHVSPNFDPNTPQVNRAVGECDGHH